MLEHHSEASCAGANVVIASACDGAALTPLFRQYLAFYHRHPDEAEVREFLQARLAANECVIHVARVGDTQEIGGFTLIYPTYTSLGLRRSWILNDLFVAEQHRREGIARLLVHAVHRHAADTGAALVELETARSNRSAQRLYETEGYRRESEFVRYSRAFPAAPR